MQDTVRLDKTPGQTHLVAWDVPLRIFHWIRVALIICAWVSYTYAENFSDPLLKWHRLNGLAILTLLVWRLLWGVAGSGTARFSSFVKGPRAALAYARSLMGGRTQRYLGHNPLGAWMVLALLLTVFVQASFGLFTVDHNDLTAGPLYRFVSEEATKFASRWHHRVFDWLLLPLIAIHFAANVLYGLIKREPLIPAMITGRKPVADYEDLAEAGHPGRPLLRATILLAVSAALVLGTIRLLAGRLI